ncbi:DNA-3-methyladenine glycosylase I [Streptomyces sp. NPDC096311]|uniref:DNA-3-methyladenine glycosylase I n=1 Tax=Streptomyces sp. NPDC096311 TaxID=3366083 RepID=UPI0038004035
MTTVMGADGRARCPWAATDDLLRDYHDTEWGLPVIGEAALFERITLEGFQAGLSWRTVLAKRPAFRDAFDGFDPDTVARLSDSRLEQLTGHAGIIRNRKKIEAARTNARAVVRLRLHDCGGLEQLVLAHRPATTPEPHQHADIPTSSPESAALANALRAHGFTFVGPTGMYALMEATGLINTHLVTCHRRGAFYAHTCHHRTSQPSEPDDRIPPDKST